MRLPCARQPRNAHPEARRARGHEFAGRPTDTAIKKAPAVNRGLARSLVLIRFNLQAAIEVIFQNPRRNRGARLLPSLNNVPLGFNHQNSADQFTFSAEWLQKDGSSEFSQDIKNETNGKSRGGKAELIITYGSHVDNGAAKE
jgi:hypothetical protein